MSHIIRLLIMFSCSLLVACGSASESKVDLQAEENNAQSKPLEGRWILSHVTTPYGDVLHRVKGIYHYYTDGTFTGQTMFPDRLDLDANPETLEEFKSAFLKYFAGFGTYSIDKQAGTITFCYDGSLRPHRMKSGKTYTYLFELSPQSFAFTCDKGYKFSYTR